MNIRLKLKEVSDIIVANEETYARLLKEGSKDHGDYYNLIYFSGVRNGFNLVFHALESKLSEKEFDDDVVQVLQSFGKPN